MTVISVLKLSQPQMWMYVAGPYLIGYGYGMTALPELFLSEFLLRTLFFLVPANICLYAIESLHLNKITRATKKQWKIFFLCLLVSLLLNLILLVFENSYIARLLIFLFFVSTVTLNIPYLRYKGKYLYDFLALIPFVVSGLYGYYLASGHLPGWPIPAAVCSLYTGIFILSSIAKPGAYRHGWFVRTVERLGGKKSLIISAGLLTISSGIFVLSRILMPWSFFMLVYPLLPIILIVRPRISIAEITYYFPEFNTAILLMTFALIITAKPL